MGSSLPDTPRRLYPGGVHPVCTRAGGERGSGPSQGGRWRLLLPNNSAQGSEGNGPGGGQGAKPLAFHMGCRGPAPWGGAGQTLMEKGNRVRGRNTQEQCEYPFWYFHET